MRSGLRTLSVPLLLCLLCAWNCTLPAFGECSKPAQGAGAGGAAAQAQGLQPAAAAAGLNNAGGVGGGSGAVLPGAVAPPGGGAGAVSAGPSVPPTPSLSAAYAAARATSLANIDGILGFDSEAAVANLAPATGTPAPAPAPAAPAPSGPLDPVSKILRSPIVNTLLGLLNLPGDRLALIRGGLQLFQDLFQGGVSSQGASATAITAEDMNYLMANPQELLTALEQVKQSQDQAAQTQAQAQSAEATEAKDRWNRHIEWQIQELQKQKK